MSKFTTISCVFFCLLGLAVPGFADVVPAGDVSGTWSLAGSPWVVTGSVVVPMDQTLTIEAGVDVRFQGSVSLTVYGQLLAVGAVGDTIYFRSDAPGPGWLGLRFQDTTTNTQPQSEVRYCRLQDGEVFGTCPANSGGAIFCGRSAPLIANNLITDNESRNGLGDWGGGGIYCEYASPEIRDNVITGNTTGGDGGGIYCTWSQPLITGNVITGNHTPNRGGGIALFQYSSAQVLGNTISDNSAEGVYASGSAARIENNIVSGHTGSGLRAYLCSPQIVGNLIVDNGGLYGAGVWIQGASPSIVNCTIADNTGVYNGGVTCQTVMVGIAVYSHPTLTNCIVWGNTGTTGAQVYAAPGNSLTAGYSDVDNGAGALSGTVTFTAGTIHTDPLFDVGGSRPYALTAASLCRNAGTPDVSGLNLPDEDLYGNDRICDGCVDMGACEYTAGVGVPLARPARLSNWPNPFNPGTTIGFDLVQDEAVILTIFDLRGRKVRDLFQGRMTTGPQTVWFDGRDDRGQTLAAGTYLCRLQVADQATARVVSLVK